MNIGPALFIVGRLVQSATLLSLLSLLVAPSDTLSAQRAPSLSWQESEDPGNGRYKKKKKGGIKDKEGMMMMDCRGNGWWRGQVRLGEEGDTEDRMILGWGGLLRVLYY